MGAPEDLHFVGVVLERKIEAREERGRGRVSDRHVAGHAQVVRAQGCSVRAFVLRRLGGVGEHVSHERERLRGDGHLAQPDAKRVRERAHLVHLVARPGVCEAVGPAFAVGDPRPPCGRPEFFLFFGAAPQVDEVVRASGRSCRGE